MSRGQIYRGSKLATRVEGPACVRRIQLLCFVAAMTFWLVGGLQLEAARETAAVAAGRELPEEQAPFFM